MIGGSLKGRAALITGGGRGMGAESARVLTEHGVSVLINDVNSDLAEETAAELASKGGKAAAVGGDVRNEDDVRAMINRAVTEFGALHILLNNAGVLRPTRVEQITTEDFWHKGELIVLKNVPIGICNTCKNRYYSAEVLEKLEEAFQNRATLKTMEVPVYDCAVAG